MKVKTYLTHQLPTPNPTRPLEQVNQHNKQHNIHNRPNSLIEHKLHRKVPRARSRHRLHTANRFVLLFCYCCCRFSILAVVKGDVGGRRRGLPAVLGQDPPGWKAGVPCFDVFLPDVVDRDDDDGVADELEQGRGVEGEWFLGFLLSCDFRSLILLLFLL